MVFSVYPQEREAILRVMQHHRLKSTFDVVRLLVHDPKAAAAVRKTDFNPIRRRL
jgi:hypothetical protein